MLGTPHACLVPRCTDPRLQVNYLCQSLPFGGVNISGFDRFAGIEGIRGCCNMRAVTSDRLTATRTMIPPPMQVRQRSLLLFLFFSLVFDVSDAFLSSTSSPTFHGAVSTSCSCVFKCWSVEHADWGLAIRCYARFRSAVPDHPGELPVLCRPGDHGVRHRIDIFWTIFSPAQRRATPQNVPCDLLYLFITLLRIHASWGLTGACNPIFAIQYCVRFPGATQIRRWVLCPAQGHRRPRDGSHGNQASQK